MADLAGLAEAIIKGDMATATRLTTEALGEGTAPKTVLDDGLIAGMDVIGGRFSKGEVFIPEVLIAARAMKAAMAILEPELAKAGVEPVGRIVIGTVKGDLHDIGKNLVAMMMKGAGFDVIDLGVDVSSETFVEQVKAHKADMVGMSALLTTTMPAMEQTVKALNNSGLPVKILVGGAPLTQEYADKIGAHGFAVNAAESVTLAKQLVA
jgi:5-methyltetrahydrofolate--homocysteine methyltransferase